MKNAQVVGKKMDQNQIGTGPPATFGQWLREQRKAEDLRLTDCALRAGVSVQVWSDWEHDRSRRQSAKPTTFSDKTLEKMATGLGFDVSVVTFQARHYAVSASGKRVDESKVKISLSSQLSEIGRRIANMRERLNLTQSEVADELNIDQRTLSCYEAGLVDIPCSRLLALAKVLTVDVCSILCDQHDEIHPKFRPFDISDKRHA